MKEGKTLLYMNLLFMAFCFYCVVILFSQNTYMRRKMKEGGVIKNADASEQKSPVGGKVLDVAVETLSGEKNTLHKILKKNAFLYVWKPSCPYCREVSDDIEKSHNNFPGAFLSLTFKTVSEDKKEVDTYKEEHHLSFPIYLSAQGEFYKPFVPYGIPAIYEVRGGKIVRFYEGLNEVRALLKQVNKKITVNERG